jgi:hypothetical protein
LVAGDLLVVVADPVDRDAVAEVLGTALDHSHEGEDAEDISMTRSQRAPSARSSRSTLVASLSAATPPRRLHEGRIAAENAA